MSSARASPSVSTSGRSSWSRTASSASLRARAASSRSLIVLKRSFLRTPLDAATIPETSAKSTSRASSWASASSLLAKATRVARRLSSGMREIACALTEPAVRARARSLPSGKPVRSRDPAPSERTSQRRSSARTIPLPLTLAGALRSLSSAVCRTLGSTRRRPSWRARCPASRRPASLAWCRGARSPAPGPGSPAAPAWWGRAGARGVPAATRSQGRRERPGAPGPSTPDRTGAASGGTTPAGSRRTCSRAPFGSSRRALGWWVPAPDIGGARVAGVRCRAVSPRNGPRSRARPLDLRGRRPAKRPPRDCFQTKWRVSTSSPEA